MLVYWILGILLFGILFLAWQNGTLTVTHYTYRNQDLPKAADGVKIAQLSDWHNAPMQKRALFSLKKEAPDAIVLTGDLVERHMKHFERLYRFVEKLSSLAPVYYVRGNHEFAICDQSTFAACLEKAGATVLANQSVSFKGMTVLGINDVLFWMQSSDKPWDMENGYRLIRGFLLEQTKDKAFVLLLAHRPRMEVYQDTGVTLALCGHHHGGMWRIPGIKGGLIAPDEGFFPKHTDGFYREGTTTMLVSRGIGNTGITLRLFNRPELVYVTMHRA